MQVDLRQFSYEVLSIARENLIHDGLLVPIAFIITAQENMPFALQFDGPEQKEAAYRGIVAKARELNALAIVTLNDAYFQKEDADRYYPGKLAAERAPECILITVSGPGMETWNLTTPYQRTPDGFVFSEPMESSGSTLGLLAGWASDSPLLS